MICHEGQCYIPCFQTPDSLTLGLDLLILCIFCPSAVSFFQLYWWLTQDLIRGWISFQNGWDLLGAKYPHTTQDLNPLSFAATEYLCFHPVGETRWKTAGGSVLIFIMGCRKVEAAISLHEWLDWHCWALKAQVRWHSTRNAELCSRIHGNHPNPEWGVICRDRSRSRCEGWMELPTHVTIQREVSGADWG